LLLSSVLAIGGYSSISLFKKRIDHAINDTRELQEGNFNTSWGLRAAFWVVTYDALHTHPFIGSGIGDYRLAARETFVSNLHHFNQKVINWCSDTHYHNQYLMILVQTGLIGFGLMIWLFIELFKLKIDNPQLNEFKILGLTTFIVASISEPLWILQFPIILFIFITSVSIAASKKNDKVSLV
jgi:O-antigen ligase